jgi:plastocyanin
MPLTSKRRKVLLAMGVLVISIAGCSKSNGQATSTGTAPPVSLSGKVNDHGTTDLTSEGSTPTVDMQLDDNFFAPTYLKVAPGATVKLELHNDGSRQHTVTTDTGVDVVVDPGHSGEAVLTAPATGQQAFYCRFHKNTGMQGAVVVTTGDSTTGAPPASSSSPASSTTTTKPSSGGYGY